MIKIHGKDYVEVKDRIKHFRELEKYDDWSIDTNIIEITPEKVITKTVICDEVGKVMSTGIAYEMANSSHINKTSYIENCETSSVGRALGFLGIGIDGSIASADEVENAISQQQDIKGDVKIKVVNPKGDIDEEIEKINGAKTQKEASQVYQEFNDKEFTDDEKKIFENAVKLVKSKFDGELQE